MKPPSRRSTRTGRKAVARQSPQYQAALAAREASGRERPKQPRKLKAIDKPLTLGPEEVVWVKSMLIYEDASVMGFNKPTNLSSQGGRGNFHNLDDLMWAFAKSNGKKPRLVHRLDRDTSGIIVAAKTKPAAAFLGNAIAARQVHKTYLCVVTNPHNLKDEGRIDVALRREEEGREAYSRVCDADHPEALTARTDYRVLKRTDEAALVLCEPYTGRMHQIRVHMAHMGSPIAGDVRYGGALSLGGRAAPRLMLHARGFEFPHPEGGRKRLEAHLSIDIRNMCLEIGLIEEGDVV
ncbi:MAG: RluA family pseudouridine synthase [Asticcacaulis sp.]